MLYVFLLAAAMPSDPPADVSEVVTVIMAVLALLTAAAGAVKVFFDKKLKAPTDVLAERKLELDTRTLAEKGSQDILDRFQTMLDEQATKHADEIRRLETRHLNEVTAMREAHAAALADVNHRFTELEAKFGHSEERNQSLVNFIYRLVRIIKDAGLDDKLQQVEGKPHGIVIY